MNSKWNGVIFGFILGILLAMCGFTIQANPFLVIFLIIAINILHMVFPHRKLFNE